MGKVNSRRFVGVDLGGTNIQVGIIAPNNRVLGRAKSKTKPEGGSAEVIRRIGDTVREAIQDAGLEPGDVAGLGIGAPGAVDPGSGIVLNAPNLRWNRFGLAKALSQQLKMPVTIDNDVNVAVWGEYVAGAVRNHQDVLGVWVGTGIGGGLILNGELYHGRCWTAGEIGHTVLHADAPLGRRTLENSASRTAITNLLTQLILANNPSKLTQLVNGDLTSIRSKVLAKALELNDGLTEDVMKQAARYVGIAVANTVSVLSLPCVVIGGGMTVALGKTWVAWVREAFQEHVFPHEMKKHCQVIASDLGDDSGIIGAGVLARERLAGSNRMKKK